MVEKSRMSTRTSQLLPPAEKGVGGTGQKKADWAESIWAEKSVPCGQKKEYCTPSAASYLLGVGNRTEGRGREGIAKGVSVHACGLGCLLPPRSRPAASKRVDQSQSESIRIAQSEQIPVSQIGSEPFGVSQSQPESIRAGQGDAE